MTVAEAICDSLDSSPYGKQRLPELHFGWPPLDELTGGIPRGNLTIIGGESGVGKTTLALNILSSASDTGPCLFFSLSLRPKELADRLICSTADIPQDAYRGGYMSGQQVAIFKEVLTYLAKKPIQFAGHPGATLKDLEDSITTMNEAGTPPTTVIVDDILSLAPDDKHRSHAHEITAHSRRLRQIAAEHDCAVIATLPLPHSIRRPTLADLRGMGMIEFDASLIIFLHRFDIHDQQHEHAGAAELILAKNSFGRLGTLAERHKMDHWQFINRDYG